MPKESDELASLNNDELKYFRSKLVGWRYRNKVRYPWRSEKSKYYALCAEILLQRTRAEQVIPVYKEFIKKFGSAKRLANASIKSIEKCISQLGLLWRAKRLKQLGKAIVNRYAGEVPETYAELTELPCVGRYVASAFLSFHVNEWAAILDSNIVRSYGRFFGFRTNPETRKNKELIEFSELITPSENFRKYNYSVLDLGRNICRINPLCKKCPVAAKCHYFIRGEIL